MFVDIHTHCFPPKSKYAICNLNVEEAQEFLQSDKQSFFSSGFHPWYLNQYSEKRISELEQMLSDKRILAIGECGLDKNTSFTINEQQFVFEKQIALSEKFRKPLIIHCVGCFNELIAIKKKLNPRQLWIIHGFRGKAQLAEQLLRSGCSLSFGEKFNEESVLITPFERFFVETDESKLPIEVIYQRLAEAKKCSVSDLSAGERWLNTL